MENKPITLIAVHGGAGFHAPSSDPATKRALRLACAEGMKALIRESTALNVVDEAISVLEDEECLNAGYGSNLTEDGKVECDASLMDGRTGAVGAVGALSDVKNPVKVAHLVLRRSRAPDPLGRIPPLILVSSGAQTLARKHGINACVDSLVSPRARQEWILWKDRLQAAVAPSTTATTSAPIPDTLYHRQDTVGAIAWDTAGDLAAGVSSGGLLLKHSGRIGEAAVYGAGCWASHSPNASVAGVACSVSGAGEYITRGAVARRVCEAVEADTDGDTHGVLQRILGPEFHTLCLRHGEPAPQVGLLLVTQDRPPVQQTPASDSSQDSAPRPWLWCAFTTESMAISYASSLDPKPKAVILRRPPQHAGESPSAPIYITTLPLTRA